MTKSDLKEFINDIEERVDWKDSVNGCSWRIEEENGVFSLYKTGINSSRIKPCYISSFYDWKGLIGALSNAWKGSIATKAEWIESFREGEGADEEVDLEQELGLEGEDDDLFLFTDADGSLTSLDRII